MTVQTSNLSFKHKNVTDMTSLDIQHRVFMAHTCNKIYFTAGSDLHLTFLGTLNIDCSVTKLFLT